jgi:AraC-like DNA-binding protein
MSPLAYEGEQGSVLPVSLAGGSLLAEVVAISTASSALPSCADADEMLRVAAGLARDVIGLERVAFYMRDPSAERLILRGTWGTGSDGATHGEHGSFHELSVRDGLALQNLRESGLPGLCRPRSSWFSPDAVQQASGGGWVMATPLFAASHLVGVMYNAINANAGNAGSGNASSGNCTSGDGTSGDGTSGDGGAAGENAAELDDPSNAPSGDPGKQAAAAVLCGMVAIDYIARRGPVRFQPLGAATLPSQLVQRIRDAIDENPARRGKDLAVEFGVSPGHLARAFKREMGLSLVDYRNRKRIDRFWDTLRRRGRAYSLKQAAFDAGFGSYAQFNRIHKKLVGVGPRLGARRTEAMSFEARGASEVPS